MAAASKPADKAVSAGAFVTASLQAKQRLLLDWAPAAARDEPDAIHQMRVAARTLRSMLTTFAPLLSDDPAESQEADQSHEPQHVRLIAELRWLEAVLGVARDAEVLDMHLTELLAKVPGTLVLGPVRERIDTDLSPARDAARTGVAEALASPRYTVLVADLEAFAAHPRLAASTSAIPARRVLAEYVDRRWRRVRRRMKPALRLPSGGERDEALHDARKAVRRARYVAEAVSPVFGKKVARFGRRMKELQDLLGAQHDGVIVGEAIAHLAVNAHAAGENAFTFGVLHGLADCEARTSEGKVQKTWKRVEKVAAKTVPRPKAHAGRS